MINTRKNYTLFILDFLFWIFLFSFFRAVFLVYNLSELQDVPATQLILAFYHGLGLDVSMASYFIAIPFLCYLFVGFIPSVKVLRVKNIFTLVLISLVVIISVAELEIYNEWGMKMNIKAFKFLNDPKQIFETTRPVFFWGGLSVIAVLTFCLYKYVYLKFVAAQNGITKNNLFENILFILITPILLVLGIRGGVQQIPIQQSDAYFSNKNILNLAAVNSTWNLFQSVWENTGAIEGNPYHYYDLEDAKKEVARINYVEKDTTIKIIDSVKPNIVLCILEGWSADLVKSTGGYEGVTPNFEKLISEGILFNNLYASASLSDQGIGCIFTGFPAQPNNSVVAQPAKYASVPTIIKEFKKANYQTSFLFGGDLDYANIKAFLYYQGIDKVQDEAYFDAAVPRARLGIHDEYLYAKQLNELKNTAQPFFATLFTGSTHSPYDIPMGDSITWGGDEREYLNSAFYADKQMYKFIQEAKKQPWYSNTLFVFISDHSHITPHKYAFNQPEYRKIPMLFYGEVLKPEHRGTKYTKLASQIDLPVTLLKQLDFNTSPYDKWSKNLFNPYSPEFAYYEATDGFGWLRPNHSYVLVHSQNREEYLKFLSEEQKKIIEKEGKSYMQLVFEEFLNF
ncbi:MAG: sulfatase-like hydrolase/transferase [Bacteroidetes bacterium]|nr:sulfatase-like hydrolase/transferase [Bacteroidota bacterium]